MRPVCEIHGCSVTNTFTYSITQVDPDDMSYYTIEQSLCGIHAEEVMDRDLNRFFRGAVVVGS